MKSPLRRVDSQNLSLSPPAAFPPPAMAAASPAKPFLDEGAQHMRSDNLGAALDSYSRAVAADAASHLALSNRAIVRYKLGEWENAARDAEAAIALRAPGFGKPFSTRGAALERLGRLDEALASYEEGLRVEPGSATLSANKAKLEDSLRRRFAPNASGGGGGGGGGGARPGAEVPRFFESRPTVADDDWDAPAHTGLARWARLALLLARVALLALWLAYLLPLGREAPFLAFRALLVLSVVAHAGQLFLKFGRPSALTLEAAQSWVVDPRAGFLHDMTLAPIFAPLLFLVTGARPMVFAPAAFCLADAWYAIEFAHARLLPAFAARMLDGVGTSLASRVTATPTEALLRLAPRARRNAVLAGLLDYQAYAELACALLALAELALPQRNVMLCLMLWQVFPLRYTMSKHVRGAFAALDGRISGALAHRFVPVVVARAYAWLRGFLYTYVPDNRVVQEDEDAAAARGGAGAGARRERPGIAGLAAQAFSAARQRCTIV